ncbi:MAG: MarR family winged helix-turn-helix transcriptional regulator [Hyphomicrobiaceae bacterium]
MRSQKEIEHELDESVGFMLNITTRRVRRILQRRLNAEGLDYGAWFFLRILWVEDGLTQAQLSALTGFSQPTTAIALRKMRQSGLVEFASNPEDKRASYVFLTGRAKRMRPHFAKFITEMRHRFTKGISDDEIKTVKNVLRKIRENCED